MDATYRIWMRLNSSKDRDRFILHWLIVFLELRHMTIQNPSAETDVSAYKDIRMSSRQKANYRFMVD